METRKAFTFFLYHAVAAGHREGHQYDGPRYRVGKSGHGQRKKIGINKKRKRRIRYEVMVILFISCLLFSLLSLITVGMSPARQHR